MMYYLYYNLKKKFEQQTKYIVRAGNEFSDILVKFKAKKRGN